MSDAATPWDLVDQAFSNLKQEQAPSKMQQAVKDMTPLKGKTALVVDTALATRRAIQEQLSQLGARSVIFASSVSEVEQMLESREFALIVCEYQLEGDRNGQQLLEELRVGKKLHWNIAFMMVTGERTYSNVVAVAEFEPDDYLIKPFTASTLSDRVVRIFNRKARLGEAYSALYEGRHDEMPSVCETLQANYPLYEQEIQRLKVDSLILSARFTDAEEELNRLMDAAPKPWMQLKLAKVKSEQKRYAEAGTLLEEVVRTNPEYLAATDLFSEVLWEQNKPDEALEVLERLGAKALNSTTRLRKLADLAVRVGDDSRSKNYLTKVIDRSRSGSLSQLGDYLQLSKIYIREGKVEEAERLTSKMRTAVNSTELEFARSLMNIQKQISEGKIEAAAEKLEQFFESHADQIQTMENETQTSLLEQCFATNMQQKGLDLARNISRRKPTKAILDRIKNAISSSKQAESND